MKQEMPLLQSIATGTAVDEALKTAQETVEFAMEE